MRGAAHSMGRMAGALLLGWIAATAQAAPLGPSAGDAIGSVSSAAPDTGGGHGGIGMPRAGIDATAGGPILPPAWALPSSRVPLSRAPFAPEPSTALLLGGGLIGLLGLSRRTR